jgi:exonuclease III
MNISILSMNIRSLRGKFDRLCAYLKNMKSLCQLPTIICIQETWLTDNDDMVGDMVDKRVVGIDHLVDETAPEITI